MNYYVLFFNIFIIIISCDNLIFFFLNIKYLLKIGVLIKCQFIFRYMDLPVQPFIIIIGRQYNPTDITVYYEDIRYKII